MHVIFIVIVSVVILLITIVEVHTVYVYIFVHYDYKILKQIEKDLKNEKFIKSFEFIGNFDCLSLSNVRFKWNNKIIICWKEEEECSIHDNDNCLVSPFWKKQSKKLFKMFKSKYPKYF